MVKDGKSKERGEGSRGKRGKRLREEFEVGGLMAQKGCGTSPKKECWKTEVHYQHRKVT